MKRSGTEVDDPDVDGVAVVGGKLHALRHTTHVRRRKDLGHRIVRLKIIHLKVIRLKVIRLKASLRCPVTPTAQARADARVLRTAALVLPAHDRLFAPHRATFPPEW